MYAALLQALEQALTEVGASPDGVTPGITLASRDIPLSSKSMASKSGHALLFDRPTQLEDGERGFATWVNMFGEPFLARRSGSQTQRLPSRRRGNRPPYSLEVRSLGTGLPPAPFGRLEIAGVDAL
jgi:hypothetical protein